jgi:RimJ/RimL family protein N-acetyltransferase
MRTLDTDRLTIRRFVESDLDALTELHDACFGPEPRAHRAEWLAWTVRNYDALAMLRQPPYGDYAVTLRGGAVIGAVGLVPSYGPFDRLPWFRARLRVEPTSLLRPEMGLFWAIGPQHRRHGYATEAARAVAGFAFSKLRADRLVATTEHDNAASIGVMRGIGMTIDGNPDPEPAWFQTVGILPNPAAARR